MNTYSSGMSVDYMDNTVPEPLHIENKNRKVIQTIMKYVRTAITVKCFKRIIMVRETKSFLPSELC